MYSGRGTYLWLTVAARAAVVVLPAPLGEHSDITGMGLPFRRPPNTVALRPPPFGGTGYTAGCPQDFDRAHALDVP